jgi:hypothetical protein
MYIVNVMYGQGINDIICKICKLNIINKMYLQLQMDMDRYLGAKFPQEREGVQGGEFTHIY